MGLVPSIPSFTALQYNCPNNASPTLLPAVNVLGPLLSLQTALDVIMKTRSILMHPALQPLLQ